ncbi:MAG TPA: LPS export ABC transporter periplasmic protein LptC, partial [Candidatus Margulisiibacteriota bacterium]|nr:LPS export ABC transporter periplasmic protein LptC [Candidatus Margulisiibacteriota bacterium]
MISKKFALLAFLLIFNVPMLFAEAKKTPVESDQQISDFSLAGYGEKGKKSWDISGKSADIFSEVVKLDSVVGNLYGKEENVKLTAKRGDFNKNDGKVHLEQDVVVTTSSGAKLTTDSLDWDRKNQLVSTNDTVNVQRENMFTVAKGAKGEPNLKKV